MDIPPIQDQWQCHECNRILGVDDLGSERDEGFVLDKCLHCGSTNVDRFEYQDLVNELERIRRTDCKYTRGNLEQIQIILEGVFDL